MLAKRRRQKDIPVHHHTANVRPTGVPPEAYLKKRTEKAIPPWDEEVTESPTGPTLTTPPLQLQLKMLE
jgi:hypothetical protein